MIPLGTQRAPSPSVVLPYYVAAAVAFLVLTFLLLLSSAAFTGHYFQPPVLAITHLAALGWGTMIIFGASHQLLPVVMEVHLFSEKLAKWCFILLLAGIILLVVSFWNFTTGPLMEAGALLVLLAVVLYAANVYGTARQNKKRGVSAACMVDASWWLVLTAVLGTLLVFNLRYAFFPHDHLYYLKIHAHAGIAGWFLLMIMGVASRLVPMFLLSHHEPGLPAKIARHAVNAGLGGFVIMAFVFNTERYWPVFALAVLAGVLSYGLFIRQTWKKAVRKKTDTPMKLTLTAIMLMLIPFLLLAVLACLPSHAGSREVTFSLAYGISIFGGFITAVILGQTFKTLPFIVWMHRYKKLIGKAKTPLPRELYSESWVKCQLYVYIIGYLAILAGVLWRTEWLITLGAAGLFLAAAVYNANVFLILAHKIKKTPDDNRP